MGAKALARNNINYLVCGNCFLVMSCRNLFIHHQQGSFTNMGMPPAREKVATYLQEPPSSAIEGMVATPLQLPLLNQIWDSLLGKKGAKVQSPPRDARNVTGPHLVWWHRYTR